MALSRRQFIECAGAGGALVALGSSPLLAQALVPRALVPARPHVTVDPVIDPRILSRARAAFDAHRSRIARPEIVGIADFTRASAEPRFYLLDTASGRVTSHLVSHGRGSDPGHTGFVQQFSNRIGSEASSDGAYLTSDYYQGRYGRSMRVHGLDHTNSNAEARAIVVHSAWYAEAQVAAQTGRLGRSEGCFAMSVASLRQTLDRLGPGHFLYAGRVPLANLTV